MIWLVAAFAIVASVWCVWAIFSVEIAYWALGDIFIPAQAGPWGDSFGPFSAFFSALGFAAVVVTLRMQQDQLRSAQRDQHRQRFESSFFELLKLFREARQAVSFQHSGRYNEERKVSVLRRNLIRNGEEAFREAMQEIRTIYRLDGVRGDRDELIRLYRMHFHSRYESKLGPYYRIFYTILDRISEDKILTPDEKVQYGNLLRSQLTSHEAAMAGLNGLAPFAKDFSRLLIEFRILKYVTSTTAKRMLRYHYPKEAFESRGDQ